jgi:predicted MFS family arabinose efflux permease
MPVRVLPGQRWRHGVRGARLTEDARRIVAAQGVRALAYGLGSVLIGVTLARRGLSGAEVGGVLAALLAGIAVASVLIARYGDRFGRRRSYRLLFIAMAVAGAVFALTDWLPALILAALSGTVSTDVVESGPFTSLEQAMLSHTASGADPTRLFGIYNTVATLAGSLGALVALLGHSPHWLLAYPIAAAAGLLASARLSPAVELGHELEPRNPERLHRSRRVVLYLSALFALDSFGGGFVPQTFIAYLFTRKYGASVQTLGIVFFAIGILQALSFQAAVRLAGRFGLLRTMVYTHLPSNLLLAAIAFAPDLPSAIALLLGRFLLSQADVPARQAYVMGIVDPSERTAAAAYTNTARYLTRPIAPLLAGAALRDTLGAPFLVAGTIKSIYDVALYLAFRRVPLLGEAGAGGRRAERPPYGG